MDEIECVGDMIAVRMMLQRLFGLLAVATRHDNSWLEQQRVELVATIDTADLSTLPERLLQAEATIRRRIESTVNALFSSLNVDVRTEH